MNLNKFKTVEEYLGFYGLGFENVEHRFVEFQSGSFNLFGQFWIPKEYKATVIIVHGFMGHCGTFGKFIKFMLDNHFAVAAFDLPGHGLSSGEKTAIDDFSQYSRALEDFLKIVKEQVDEPFHIVGHSMGAAVMVDYIVYAKDNFIDKIIFAAPLVRCTLWNLSKLGYIIYNPFGKNIFRIFHNISSDKDYVKFLKHKDPLQAKSISMKWVKAMFDWEKKISKVQKIGRQALVIQGTNDTTVAWRHNLKFIQSRFEKTEIELIENSQHEFFNEAKKYRDEVFGAIKEYLKNQTDRFNV
ncbi:MAG: Phospholipase YtpA [Planctomycetes bacterium ADurb.Bin401]|nr:MAG: Phospholipase YtpA [Planctomycetes bacterium ADurb.Bin401]